MKLPKEIYVCRHSNYHTCDPPKNECYWYEYMDIPKRQCYIDRKPCKQVTYIQKDKSCTPLKNVKASAR